MVIEIPLNSILLIIKLHNAILDTNGFHFASLSPDSVPRKVKLSGIELKT